jgi:putative FmdB family regulatory protein
MPTYDYACEKCGRTFEYFQSMNDPRLTECIFEGCGGAVKRKLGTGAGIIFKGSGFYETDYRSDAYKSAKEKESKSAGGGSSEPGDGGQAAAKKEKPDKPAVEKKPAKAEPASAKPATKASSE